MDNLLWLGRIHPSDRSEVGDKAFYLNEVARRGYPTAPGFIVSAEILSTWLQGGDWQEPLLVDLLDASRDLNIDDADELQAIAQKIRHEILTAKLPSPWTRALQSAVESWKTTTLIFRPSLSISTDSASAGSSQRNNPNLSQLLESHLSGNQPDELTQALKQTWAELFRARSLFCIQRYGISLKQVCLAVLVQPIEGAIASGYLHAGPTGFEIRATVGASMAIFCGDAIPDFYRVDRATGRVQHRQLGRKVCTYQATEIGWKTDLLDEEQQQHYALPESDLDTLIELAQKLAGDLAPNFQLKWTLLPVEETECESASERSSSLLLTQVCPREPPPEGRDPNLDRLQLSPSTSERTSIQGIAVSGGVVIARAVALDRADGFPENIPPGQILVASAISPNWLPQIQQAAGFVTERGGTTSHGAILARELGIPAVVGVANATELLPTGEWIQIDGDRGEVRRMPEAVSTEKSQRLDREAPTPSRPKIHRLNIPLATRLWVNLSQQSLIDEAAKLPVDGVGLIRGERMAIEAFENPNTQNLEQWQDKTQQTEIVDRLVERLGTFARSFAPRPIYYRAFNVCDRRQTNPVLGIQGTFRIQLDTSLFDLELRAIARVRKAGCTNLHLMLPFVRTVEEFQFCRQRVERFGLLQDPSFGLWIMAEVPSVLFLLPDFVRAGVCGIAIGSNDLTQLILGADRDSSQMTQVFEARHPAVLAAMQQLIETARALKIPCSICGDAPVQYPELIDALVKWGITAISVPPNAVESTYSAIARAERRLLLDAARRQLADEGRSGKG